MYAAILFTFTHDPQQRREASRGNNDMIIRIMAQSTHTMTGVVITTQVLGFMPGEIVSIPLRGIAVTYLGPTLD